MCPMLTGTCCTETRRPTDRFPALPAVQPSASRDRCFTWPRFPGSGLTVLLPGPRSFLQSPCGMSVSEQQVKDRYLSIGVRRVTLACFPVGSSSVLSDRFLSTGIRPVRLALLRAGPSRLTCGRSCRLVSGPFLLAGSRPGAHAEELRFIPTRQVEHTVTLVLAYDRSMETPVHAPAAVARRPRVSHCTGRPVGELPRRSHHPPHTPRRRWPRRSA